MAGDWLKIDKSLPEKPEVWAIAGELDLDPDAVVGKLIRVFSWFDEHTENGHAPSVTEKLLDRLVGVTGFTKALRVSGWLFTQGDEIVLRNFTRHNGKTAKSRALGQARQEKHRNDNVTVKPSPEKRREEKSNNKKTIQKNDHPGFGIFYETYPRKSNKKAAIQAWNKLKPDESLLTLIADDVRKRVDSGHWDLTQRDYIPHPSTYLNQQRWTDEITPRTRHENRPAGNPGAAGRKQTPAERARANQQAAIERDLAGPPPDPRIVGEDGGNVRPPMGVTAG